MSHGYHALTEKEKEALRLLATGYDAKSLARHLGLSVHTINERLRDARRKLALSSSREAARLVREIENGTPQSAGDTLLGGEPPVVCVPAMPAPPPPFRRRWLMRGLAMTIALSLLAYAALNNPALNNPALHNPAQTDPAPRPAASPPAASPPAAVATAQAAAEKAARAWLALVDARDWRASWAATGQAFRALNTVEQWTAASARVRVPLGDVQARDLVMADFVPAPPAGYWVIKFRTRYAAKPDAIETVSLAEEKGGWRVVGITID